MHPNALVQRPELSYLETAQWRATKLFYLSVGKKSTSFIQHQKFLKWKKAVNPDLWLAPEALGPWCAHCWQPVSACSIGFECHLLDKKGLKSIVLWAATFILSLFSGHILNLSHSFFLLSFIKIYDPDAEVKLITNVWNPLGIQDLNPNSTNN